MTDQPDREEQVRRLLSAAASGPPPAVPDDVAARLEAEIGRLADERAVDASSGAHEPPVEQANSGDDLSRRRRLDRQRPGQHGRRRHWWPAALVAAAAVSVVGVGVGTVLEDRPPDGDAALSTESGASSPGEAGADVEGGAALPPGDVGAEGLDGTARGGEPAPALHRETLRADVQRIADRDLAVPAHRPGAMRGACVQPAVHRGDEWLEVRLDGAPALLVLRATDGGRRTGELFTCDEGDDPVAAVTVTVR